MTQAVAQDVVVDVDIDVGITSFPGTGIEN